jgi:hypothetical protein
MKNFVRTKKTLSILLIFLGLAFALKFVSDGNAKSIRNDLENQFSGGESALGNPPPRLGAPFSDVANSGVLINMEYINLTADDFIKEWGGERLFDFNFLNDSKGGQGVYAGSAHIGKKGRIDPAPVPEPSTIILLGTGLLGLSIFRKRFKKN